MITGVTELSVAVTVEDRQGGSCIVVRLVGEADVTTGALAEVLGAEAAKKPGLLLGRAVARILQVSAIDKVIPRPGRHPRSRKQAGRTQLRKQRRHACCREQLGRLTVKNYAESVSRLESVLATRVTSCQESGRSTAGYKDQLLTLR
jgi:hypothetical protein